jgi:hypothetical protein
MFTPVDNSNQAITSVACGAFHHKKKSRSRLLAWLSSASKHPFPFLS